jgi:hypothetical protein
MTDEERQHTMDFILAQQAQFSADMQLLEESHKRAEARLKKSEARLGRSETQLDKGSYKIDRLERIMKLVIKAGLRARRDNRQRDQEWDRRFGELRETMAHSDQRLDALIDIVRQQRTGTT